MCQRHAVLRLALSCSSLLCHSVCMECHDGVQNPLLPAHAQRLPLQHRSPQIPSPPCDSSAALNALTLTRSPRNSTCLRSTCSFSTNLGLTASCFESKMLPLDRIADKRHAAKPASTSGRSTIVSRLAAAAAGHVAISCGSARREGLKGGASGAGRVGLSWIVAAACA